MSPLLTLCRLELLRQLRTPQVTLFVLLPALVLLPASVFAGFLVASVLVSKDHVAVPLHLPESPPVAQTLEDEDYVVVPHADPMQAWLDGQVQAAVLSVQAREGVADARDELELADRSTWVVTLVADDRGLEEDLEDELEDMGDVLLEDLVALAGGAPERDLWIARIDSQEVKRDRGGLDLDIARVSRAYGVFLASIVGFFFLSLNGVADRNSGVTETLLATPVRAWQLLWARLVGAFAVQTVAAALIAVNAALLLSAMGAGALLRELRAEYLLSGVAAVLLCDALYLLVGTWAPSAKAANNVGGGMVMLAMGGLGIGVMAQPPAWAPLAGAVMAQGWLPNAMATGSCLLLAAALVQLGALSLERRVSLRLSQGGA